MAGIVLEGGSFRGIFTAGVLDALLENDIIMPYVIGVSAGISNATSYASRQNGRNMQIMREYRNDPRYYSIGNLFKEGSIFGMDFVFGTIPNTLIPFDMETYLNYPGKFIAGVTDAETGEARYLDAKKLDPKFMALRATCAIPVLIKPQVIDGREYMDGGIADSIPIIKSIEDGNRKNIVVLTQPKDFIKTTPDSTKAVITMIKFKYPKIAKLLEHRADVYNETIKAIHKLEAQGAVLVIQPEHAVKSTEDSVIELQHTYSEAKLQVYERLDEIKAFLEGE